LGTLPWGRYGLLDGDKSEKNSDMCRKREKDFPSNWIWGSHEEKREGLIVREGA